MPDPFHLQRFLDAQAPVYAAVLDELTAGRKRSHWMWFIFPQIAGLGSSPTAQHFAIADLAEAAAFLAHLVLGPRLRESTALATAIPGCSALEIFSTPDDLKFRSSLTLFSRVPSADTTVFTAALDRFFSGEPDRRTLRLLGLR